MTPRRTPVRVATNVAVPSCTVFRLPAGLLLVGLLASVIGCANNPTEATVDVTSLPFKLWSGDTTTLDDLIGKDDRPIVVNLWATWCTPCLEEMPVLQAAHEATLEAGGHRVRFVGINVSDSPTRAAQRATDLGITYLQGRDPNGVFSAALSTVGLPVTAFVDRRGDLVSVHHGPLDTEELNTAIDRYLEPSR